MKATLHPYQEYSVKHIKDNPAAGLLLEMGMGKSLSTLTAISDMMMTGEDLGKILVIAPLAVAKNTWPAEIEKWDHTKHLDYSLVLGSEKERRAALSRKADLYITNRENVLWLVEEYGKRWPFKTVVIDELSSFKSSKAKRFRALRQVRPLIKRIVGLTGTPAPNSLLDIWSQMYLLDRGERLEKFVTRYREKYFYPVQQNGNIVYKYGLKAGAADEIYNKIGDICVSMRAKDHLKLPGRIDNTVHVYFEDEEMREYKRFMREKVLELDDKALVASNAAVLAGKLLQFTGGAVYTEKGYTEVNDTKINTIKGMFEEAQGEPMIICYQYRHELERLKEVLPEAVPFDIKTDCVERWNRGEISALLVHPAQAGHGLNLQAGGHTLVWYTLPWSLEQYQQTNARLDRQGQTETVVVHHLVAKGTIDERVMQVLGAKAGGQDDLMQALQAEVFGDIIRLK
jgi:SNF2 family DNA or RNA helicase